MKKKELSNAEIERNREFAEAMSYDSNMGINPRWITAERRRRYTEANKNGVRFPKPAPIEEHKE